MIKNKKIDDVYKKVLNKLKRIEEICLNEDLGHYKLSNLFFNYTEKTLKSLVWKTVEENKELSEEKLEEICIKSLSYVGSKDFVYILFLMLLNNESYKN